MEIEQFKKMIDSYFSSYQTIKNGKICFECEFGELIFLKQSETPDMLILFGIYINPEYREKGLCRDILYYLIDKSISLQMFKYICVQSVLSKILYEYLVRFTYKNKKFKITGDGFLYKL
jgi:hypothetical protein